jgi:hypothetical protein
MELSHDDIKRLVAAIAKTKSARRLTTVVGSKSESGTNRYFFCVKRGGGSWGWLGAKFALNWAGNVAQGGAGLNASGLGALGGGVGAISGKSSALSGLSGAFGEGVIANARDTGDENTNASYMHQLKANNGIQMIGFMDCSGSTTMNLWFGELTWWNWFLGLMDSQGVNTQIGYDAQCTVFKGKRVAIVRGKALSY